MAVISEDLLNKQMTYIEQICEDYSIDDVQEVIERIKAEYVAVSEDPRNSKLPATRLFRKAFGKVCADLGSAGGERFTVLILAYGVPKDWNKIEREAILDAWGKGPKARTKIKADGQVMTMQKAGKPVIISKIDKLQKAADGTCVIIAGQEIREGELPIPRDTHQFYQDGKTKNNSYTFPLDESWNINIYGLAEVADGFKPFFGNIYNKWADPNNKEFLPLIAPAFGVYKGVFGLNDKKSSKDKIVFNYVSAIQPDESFTDPIESEIYKLVEKGIIVSYKEAKGTLTEEQKDGIILVDMDDLADFHDEVMAKRDDKGVIIKGATGYDKTYWNRFGIGVYYLTAMKETKKGNFTLRFRDWTNKTNGGFSNIITNCIELNPTEFPLEYLVAFSTTRKPNRWDAENKVAIPDAINGDISFNSINGLRKATNKIAEGE